MSLSSSGDQYFSRGTDVSEQSSEPSCLQRHNVRILGTGKQLMFLAHGFGTNQQVWDGVLKSLDTVSTYKIILWDIMGAFSTNPDNFDFQRYSSLHAHADDLLEVLEELQVENLIYVGHSVSGMIGLLASMECPHYFERLILLGSSCRYLNDHEAGYHGGFEVDDLDQVFEAMQSNYTSWVSGFSTVFVGDAIHADAVREFSRTLFLIRPDIAFHTLKTIFQTDFREAIKKVTRPVHFLSTEKDNAVPVDVAQYMASAVPNAKLEVIPLAGHLPHLTHPHLVAELVHRHALM